MTQTSLIPRQLAVARVCFAAEPSPQDLEALGSAQRWLLYRTMVRDRLRDMITAGLPRTIALVGEPTFRADFERWLDQAPPRTRYLREILPAFVSFSLPRWSADDAYPPWTADLARYETARWEVWYQPDAPFEPAELSFDRYPVVNPALRLLRSIQPVHDERPAGEPYPAESVHLVLYRTPEHRVDVWVLNGMAADLLEAWQAGDRTVTETVRAVAERRGVQIGPSFVDKLSETIAQFLQKGIVLGSHP
ncbi:MAG: putative DNA-binding domain-containing protein [Myxococcota bacterium]